MKPSSSNHLFLFWASLALWLIPLSPRALGALPIAYLRSEKPVVSVTSRGHFVALVKEGQGLNVGDIVRTGSTGLAHIVFANGSRMILGPHTSLQIISPQTAVEPLMVRVFGAFAKAWLQENGGRTRIVTRAANAGARGTEFVIELLNEDTTQVTVIAGAVDFFNDVDGVPVESGQQSVAQVGQAPTPPKAVDVTGAIEWTAAVAGLPAEFETPFTDLRPPQLSAAQYNYERALRAEPAAPAANAALHQKLGEVYYDLGHYADATAQFAEVSRLLPTNAAALVALGQAKLGQGDTPGALAAYQAAAQLDPRNPTVRVDTALAYLTLQSNDLQRRAALLQAHDLLVNQDNALARSVLGLIELQQGHNVAAAQLLATAIQQKPDLYQAQALLALAALMQNQMPQALQAAQAAVRLRPDSAQAQGTLAFVLFFQDRLPAAAQAARRALQRNPFSVLSQLTLGRLFMAQLRTDEARNALQRALALAPDLLLVNLELGNVYIRLDMPEKALRVLRHAVEIDPNSAAAHTALGSALQINGQEAAALQEHQRALALEPDNVTARLNLATLLLQQGKLGESEQELTHALKEDPQRGLLYARLAEISLYRQNLDAAQQFARRAVELLPNSANAHYELGRVYLEQQHYIQAEQEFRQAVTLDTEFAAARYALGVTQEKTEAGAFGLPAALLGFDNLGSPGNALNLQDLQTPGANERLQAIIQDPTVARLATRAYGDTELDALLGEPQTRDFNFSSLHESADQRGLAGLTATAQETGGVRRNEGSSDDVAGLTLGQKAQSNPSGFVVLGRLEHYREGQNIFLQDDPAQQSRSYFNQPQMIIGYNYQHQADCQTRFLLHLDRTSQRAGVPGDDNDQQFLDIRSANVEFRHDQQIGAKHHLSLGASSGTRHQQFDDHVFLPNFQLTNITQYNFGIHAQNAYARDDIKLSQRLQMTVGYQLHQLEFDRQQQDVAPVPAAPSLNNEKTSGGFYNLIAAYQPNSRSSFRLRARSLLGTVDDFELLAPSDVFLLSYTDYPQLNLLGRGKSQEFEYDYTFRNASFLRLGAFSQNLSRGGNGLGTNLPIQQRGMQMSYEGILNRRTTYFSTLNLLSARDLQSNQYVDQIPRCSGSLGLQYLSPQGWFFEPSLSFFSQRAQTTTNVSGPSARTGLPAIQLLNLRAGKRIGLRSAIFIEVNNAFNRSYTVNEIIQPSRSFHLGITRRY